MRRIVVLLTVVVLLMVMLAMSVAPAFAAPATFHCVLGGGSINVAAKDAHDYRALGYTCTHLRD